MDGRGHVTERCLLWTLRGRETSRYKFSAAAFCIIYCFKRTYTVSRFTLCVFVFFHRLLSSLEPHKPLSSKIKSEANLFFDLWKYFYYRHLVFNKLLSNSTEGVRTDYIYSGTAGSRTLSSCFHSRFLSPHFRVESLLFTRLLLYGSWSYWVTLEIRFVFKTRDQLIKYIQYGSFTFLRISWKFSKIISQRADT